MARNRWVPWDVAYFRNPKARSLGKDGRALHLASSCWSADNLQDGFVPRQVLPLLCAEAEVPKKTVTVMVAAGAWIEVEGGWEVHDFLEHNQSRAEVEAERAKWAKKKRGQRTVSPGDKSGDSPGDSLGSLGTDRQTDHDHEKSVQVLDNDDRTQRTDGSSSSDLEHALDIAARAVWLQNPEAVNGTSAQRFIAGTRRNLVAERRNELRALLNDGKSAEQAAAVIVGSQTHARLAARDLAAQESA